MRVLRNNRVIREYAPPKRQHVAVAPSPLTSQILAAIRAADKDRRVLSVRELQAECGISSTSVVEYHMRRLAADGDIVRGACGKSRSYRLTPQGRGYGDDTELLARCLNCLELADVCEPLMNDLRMRLR